MRSHQCTPMSAKAREAPPAAASTRQLSSVSSASQSCRYEPCSSRTGADSAVGHPGPGLPDGGVEAVHERHRCRDAGRQPPARRAPAPRRTSTARGFSQMTCLPAAIAARTSGAWVAFGVQMCTMSTSSAASSSSTVSVGVVAPTRSRRGVGGLRRRSDDAGDHSPGTADGPGVHGSHEPGTDDAGTNRWGHGVLLERFRGCGGAAADRLPRMRSGWRSADRCAVSAAKARRSSRRTAWRIGSGTGAASSSRWVYGSDGVEVTVAASPCSTIEPRCITATRWLMCRTTERSWVTKR